MGILTNWLDIGWIIIRYQISLKLPFEFYLHVSLERLGFDAGKSLCYIVFAINISFTLMYSEVKNTVPRARISHYSLSKHYKLSVIYFVSRSNG